MTTNIFEIATQQKLRFKSSAGNLTVEDLWDLPLQTARANQASLLDVAKYVQEELNAYSGNSFLKETTSEAEVNAKLKMEILEHIRDAKRKEAEEREEAKARASQRHRLDEIIAEKQMDDLKNKPVEELEKLRDSI